MNKVLVPAPFVVIFATALISCAPTGEPLPQPAPVHKAAPALSCTVKALIPQRHGYLAICEKDDGERCVVTVSPEDSLLPLVGERWKVRYIGSSFRNHTAIERIHE